MNIITIFYRNAHLERTKRAVFDLYIIRFVGNFTYPDRLNNELIASPAVHMRIYRVGGVYVSAGETVSIALGDKVRHSGLKIRRNGA